jgi:hypothetical protein
MLACKDVPDPVLKLRMTLRDLIYTALLPTSFERPNSRPGQLIHACECSWAKCIGSNSLSKQEPKAAALHSDQSRLCKLPQCCVKVWEAAAYTRPEIKINVSWAFQSAGLPSSGRAGRSALSAYKTALSPRVAACIRAPDDQAVGRPLARHQAPHACAKANWTWPRPQRACSYAQSQRAQPQRSAQHTLPARRQSTQSARMQGAQRRGAAPGGLCLQRRTTWAWAAAQRTHGTCGMPKWAGRRDMSLHALPMTATGRRCTQCHALAGRRDSAPARRRRC